MKNTWIVQISILMLLVATLFSTGVTFGDTGNQPRADVQENPQKRGFIGRAALQDRLNDAVAEGKITAEEAVEKMAKFGERTSEKREVIQSRLNDAVAEGKITAEEAAERMAKFEDAVENGGGFGKGQRRNFNQNSNVQNNNSDSEVYQTV